MNQKQKNLYDTMRVSREIRQFGVKEDTKKKYSWDEEAFKQGLQWYEAGFELNDADPKLRENTCFVNGYERGKRLQDLNLKLRKLGNEYAENGIAFNDIPENYKNNDEFISGYNEVKNKRR